MKCDESDDGLDRLATRLHEYNRRIHNIKLFGAALGAEVAITASMFPDVIYSVGIISRILSLFVIASILFGSVGLYRSLGDFTWRASIIDRIIIQNNSASSKLVKQYYWSHPEIKWPCIAEFYYSVTIFGVLFAALFIIILLTVAIVSV